MRTSSKFEGMCLPQQQRCNILIARVNKLTQYLRININININIVITWTVVVLTVKVSVTFSGFPLLSGEHFTWNSQVNVVKATLFIIFIFIAIIISISITIVRVITSP